MYGIFRTVNGRVVKLRSGLSAVFSLNKNISDSKISLLFLFKVV